MTRLKYALSAILLVTGSASTSIAKTYDEWNCREGEKLKLTALQCVSCGVQSYFSEKVGHEVVPSERWMFLLGMTAKQTIKLGGRGVPSEDTDRNQQMRVIKQIQRYGFCTNYGDKRKRDPKKPYWRDYAFNFTNRGNADESKLNEIAESFGFAKNSFLGFGNKAGGNMRYLLNNVRDYNKSDDESGNGPVDFGAQSFSDKRTTFQKRLKETLDSGYDVSGEKKSGSSTSIASTPDGDDLRVCLEQVDQMQSGNSELSSFFQSNKENIAFCKTMADSCGIEDQSFCGTINGGSDSGGSGTIKPVPRPAYPGPNGPGGGLPPPPGQRPGGVN